MVLGQLPVPSHLPFEEAKSLMASPTVVPLIHRMTTCL